MPDRDALWRCLGKEKSPTHTPLLARREFLKLAGASIALAGAGCAQPLEPIVPYVDGKEGEVPALPRFYASAMTLGGMGKGILVETNTGRPTKVEGNPQHPASLGATDVFAQAAVLQFWDPDRSQSARHGTIDAPREACFAELDALVAGLQDRHGEGLRILTAYVASPTLQQQLASLLRALPAARWHQWDPLHEDEAQEGARAAFGRPLEPLYRFDATEVILSLDADFLGEGPAYLRYARDFIKNRSNAERRRSMSRLYVAESRPTLAGAMADHRLAMPLPEIEQLLGQLPELLQGVRGGSGFLASAAQALASKPGRALIVPGGALSAGAHARVHALNERLRAPGNTVMYVERGPGLAVNCTQSLKELTDDMRAGRVRALIVLGGNPVYDAPADLGFAEALARVPFSLHLSEYDDETSALATWHLPQTHFFEHWSDARAYDGTAAIVQPVIAPLRRGTSPHELLSTIMRAPQPGYESVRGTWSQQAEGSGFEAFWQQALRRGVIEGTAYPSVSAAARRTDFSPKPAPGFSVRFMPDASVRDGEYANNAWLQELPRPHTKLTWDNAALLGVATAGELGIETGDLLEVRTERGAIRAPAWVLPGHAEHSVSLPLGYGRVRAGRVGNLLGFDAYRLRGSAAPWTAEARITRTGEHYTLATTQSHSRMEGRDLLRHASLAQFLSDPGRFREQPHASLYPDWAYNEYRWGMAIDLSACIGCNACTIACQAENNIPTVGKDQVLAGREMHWIRVDRYYEGEPEAPRTLFMPVPCMHCETAPCEEVCPVGATVHDSEGLNLQVYNRCIGTRFCSNNCPYKVRRFNFLQFADNEAESLKAARNPEVTVRRRGVMEKCTYCVQRITRARIQTEEEGRRIRDGEVITACQAVCPTEAIVFGDLNDPKSRVNAVKGSALNYSLLGELNTRPRTTYLARLSNPDPALKEGPG